MSEPHDPRVRVWVDFNDADSRGRVTTLRKFCPEPVAVGHRVLAADSEGTEAFGVVEAEGDELLWIRLDPNCQQCIYRADGRCVCEMRNPPGQATTPDDRPGGGA